MEKQKEEEEEEKEEGKEGGGRRKKTRARARDRRNGSGDSGGCKKGRFRGNGENGCMTFWLLLRLGLPVSSAASLQIRCAGTSVHLLPLSISWGQLGASSPRAVLAVSFSSLSALSFTCSLTLHTSERLRVIRSRGEGATFVVIFVLASMPVRGVVSYVIWYQAFLLQWTHLQVLPQQCF